MVNTTLGNLLLKVFWGVRNLNPCNQIFEVPYRGGRYTFCIKIMAGQHRVLIVEDQQVVADALRDLIDDQHDMTVVGVAGSVAESTSQASELRPDIIVMDFRLPDGNGAEAGSNIHEARPEAKLVFLSRDDTHSTRLAAFNVGARAFINKSNAASSLIDTLRVVGRGESLMDPPSMDATNGDSESSVRLNRRSQQRRTIGDRRRRHSSQNALSGVNRGLPSDDRGQRLRPVRRSL